MIRITPHLNFNGDCEAAFQSYEKVLGGKIAFMMRYSESPMAEQAPPGFGKKIMHATFEIGDQKMFGADSPPDRHQTPQGFAIGIEVQDPAEAERIFSALSDGAVVQMPLQQTFWAQRFGMLVDKFGTPWMINCGNPQ
jgi:PhnB protein